MCPTGASTAGRMRALGWVGRECWAGAWLGSASAGLFFPVDIQPPLEESGPQESTAALTMQIPEEPSRVHQPVTRDMGPLEASQKPETEKARNPGK